MKLFVAASLILSAVLMFCQLASAEEVDLFDGHCLGGWNFFAYQSEAKMQDVWSVKDGVLVCKGNPIGYLSTKGKFENFRLTLQWRWAPGKEPGNSGVLLRIASKPVTFLPNCIEAQLKSGSAGDIWAFHGAKCQGAADRFKTIKDHDALGDFMGVGKIKANENPPGQWNTYDITFQGGDLTVAVNGQIVNRATDCDQLAGPIGLQSEGAEIHFRNIRLTPLD